MDSSIARSGRPLDMYGALMRGYQGAMVRQQDQQQQEDRATLIGALDKRYGALQDQYGAGYGELSRLAPEVLQREQEQAQYAQQQQEKAGPVMYEVARQLSQIPAEERQAAANHVLKIMGNTNPTVARAMVETFTDLSDEGISGALMVYNAFAPKGSAETENFNRLTEAGGLSEEEVARAARISLGLEGRQEPVSSAPQTVGQPHPDENGNMVQTMRAPNGDVYDVPTGTKHFQPTPTYVGEAILQASNANIEAQSKADRAERMAAEFSGRFKDAASGAAGEVAQAVKEFFGTEDDLAMLRTEQRGFLNAETVAALPPGPATDRDLKIMRSGFPKDFADTKQTAKWLDARARLYRAKAHYEGFREQYLSENQSPRGLLGAWKEYLKTNPVPGADVSNADSAEIPKGIDPAVWAEMTPEERALFK